MPYKHLLAAIMSCSALAFAANEPSLPPQLLLHITNSRDFWQPFPNEQLDNEQFDDDFLVANPAFNHLIAHDEESDESDMDDNEYDNEEDSELKPFSPIATLICKTFLGTTTFCATFIGLTILRIKYDFPF